MSLFTGPQFTRNILRTAVLTSLLLAGCQQKSKPIVSGTIETDEAHIASRYGGRVEKIFAHEGDALEAGQVIVQLEASELPAQRDHAAAALADLQAGPRPQEIAAAKSDWEAQQSALDLAQLENQRTVKLFADKTVSEAERDRAASQVNSLLKNTAAAKSRYELLLAGTRPDLITQAKAELAGIDEQLRELKILAPGNTVLETLSVKVGDVVPVGREVATLALAKEMWVRVYVPETWLGYAKVGDKVSVAVDSFPGKNFPGVVEQIARVAEFTPRNVQTTEERMKQVFGVKIRLEFSEQLRPGMSVDATFPSVPESFR